jgi:glycosyltransferase involved in cell wall biosynthesis
MEYVRHLMDDIAGKLSARFTLLTTHEAARHQNCKRLAADYAEILTVQAMAPPHRSHRGYRAWSRFAEEQWTWAEMAQEAMRSTEGRSIDFVLLPQLEVIGLLHLGMRRPAFAGKPWATIATGIRFHHHACGVIGSRRWFNPVQGFFFRRVLADQTLMLLGTIDPYLPIAARHAKVVYCPDPCPAPVPGKRAHAREAYGLRPGTFVVLVFGVIDRRKCLDVLLEAAARIDPDIDLTVLVVGPQARNDVRAALEGLAARKLRDAGRLIEVNRFILSGEDPHPVDAADAVWVFYEPNFVYSSSVLVRSARTALPVIARRRGIIGRQVVDNDIGFALDSDAPEPIAEALTRLARDQALRRRMGEAGTKAFAGHDPAAFARPMTDAIVEYFSSMRRPDTRTLDTSSFERDAGRA